MSAFALLITWGSLAILEQQLCRLDTPSSMYDDTPWRVAVSGDQCFQQQISVSSEDLAAYSGSCRGGKYSCIRLLQASSSGCAWQLQHLQLRLLCSETLLKKIFYY